MLIQLGFQGFYAKIAEMIARQGFQGFLSLLPNNSNLITLLMHIQPSQSLATVSVMPTPPQTPLFRWAAVLLTMVVVSPSLLACTPNESEALQPLMEACQGKGIANAADYDPKSPEKPVVAGFVFGKDLQKLDNRYVSGRFKRASTAQNTQLVLCVDLQPFKTLGDCRYTGAATASVPRTERTATVKLVSAKTGKVVKTGKVTAQISTCPPSITAAPSDSSWNIHQETVEFNPFNADFPLRDKINEWSFQAIKPSSSPKSPKS